MNLALIIVACAIFLAVCAWILNIVLSFLNYRLPMNLKDGGKDGMNYVKTPIRFRRKK